ncbi:MAG: hypothetical protein U1E76_18370 [Planctomycetota bacterium]
MPLPAFLGIDSALAMAGGATLLWTPVKDAGGAPAGDVSYLVYTATAAESFDFATPAMQTAAGASSAVLSGLPDGVATYVLVRATSAAANFVADFNWNVLPVIPGPVVYVDWSQAGSPGDGSAPDHALGSITDGITRARGAGGGNVWIRSGDYVESLVLPGSVSLFGGFDAGFDALTRSRVAHPTRLLSSAASKTALDIVTPNTKQVVDGLVLAGQYDNGSPAAQQGLQAKDASVAMVDTLVDNFRSDGVHFEMTQAAGELFLHRCEITRNGAQGIDHFGPARISVVRTRILANQNEGLQADALSAFPQSLSYIVLRSCNVSANRDDGVNIKYNELDRSIGRTSLGATERVLVESCFISGNLNYGVQLDVDFDADDEIDASGWVRGSILERNGLDGVRIDGDQPASFLVEGSKLTGNSHNGYQQNGDSANLVCAVVNCALLGNGAGGATGAKSAGVVAAFSVIAGNHEAGLQGVALGSRLYSSVALQNNPDLAGARAFYSLVEETPRRRGPDHRRWRSRHSRSCSRSRRTAARTTASRPISRRASPGDVLEIADDGVKREVSDVAAGIVIFAPPFSASLTLTTAVFLQDERKVTEDFLAATGSALVDRLPARGRSPARAPTRVFSAARVRARARARGAVELPWTPDCVAWPAAARLSPLESTGAFSDLRMRFSTPVDARTVSADSFRVARNGVPVDGSLTVDDREVIFTPSHGSKPGTYRIGIGPGIAGKDGQDLVVAFEYEVVVP